MPELQSAIARGAAVHLFGEPYLPNRDGIHDIHMKQGSAAKFAQYNGVWQDGAVFLYNPAESRTTALFFAFASQAIHTDEATGYALPGSRVLADLYGRPNRAPAGLSAGPAPAPIRDDRCVAIVAALVNPEGDDN